MPLPFSNILTALSKNHSGRWAATPVIIAWAYDMSIFILTIVRTIHVVKASPAAVVFYTLLKNGALYFLYVHIFFHRDICERSESNVHAQHHRGGQFGHHIVYIFRAGEWNIVWVLNKLSSRFGL